MLIKELTYEKRKLAHSLIFPVLFVLIMWIVKIAELTLEESWARLGILPLDLSGLIGVLTSPFIHGDLSHLASNTVPILTLGTALFYFYRKVAYKVFGLIYIMTGLFVWLMGRDAYHIGASGVAYALAAFLFASGVFKWDMRLLAVSLTIVFLYGSLVWGVFPIVKTISWESHLMGAITGFVLAIYYRKEGPQRPKYSWEMEDDAMENEDNSADLEEDKHVTIFYNGVEMNNKRTDTTQAKPEEE